MSEVEFEQDNINYNYNMQKRVQSSSFANFLLKKGIAKNEKQANVIMLSIGIIFLLISIILITNSLRSGDTLSAGIEITDTALDRLPVQIQEAIIRHRK